MGSLPLRNMRVENNFVHVYLLKNIIKRHGVVLTNRNRSYICHLNISSNHIQGGKKQAGLPLIIQQISRSKLLQDIQDGVLICNKYFKNIDEGRLGGSVS